MNEDKCLRLKNQICFPLYAASNVVIKRYGPLLKELDLTYTQYITMMVLWEKKNITVKNLGECLFLNSGTLTPLLKKLEAKGYIKRERLEKDERSVVISLTKDGEKLKNKAVKVPNELSKELRLTSEEKEQLYKILYKILEYNGGEK